jgi:hypothetical protein
MASRDIKPGSGMGRRAPGMKRGGSRVAEDWAIRRVHDVSADKLEWHFGRDPLPNYGVDTLAGSSWKMIWSPVGCPESRPREGPAGAGHGSGHELAAAGSAVADQVLECLSRAAS